MYDTTLSKTVLDEKQSRVYLATLRLGEARAPEIAKVSGVKRTTTYGILDELTELGLVQRNSKGKISMFRALDPERLLEIADEKKKIIEKLMPDLMGAFLRKWSAPRIMSFNGLGGIKKIYKDALECKSKKIRQIVRIKEHTEVLGEAFIKNYIKERVSKGVSAYDLHPKGDYGYSSTRGMENSALKRFVRYLPPGIFHAAIVLTYDDKVAMVSTKKENFGFIIQSQEFADTFQAYFEFIWGLGSKTPN